jgi:hypothetical protein
MLRIVFEDEVVPFFPCGTVGVLYGLAFRSKDATRSLPGVELQDPGRHERCTFAFSSCTFSLDGLL